MNISKSIQNKMSSRISTKKPSELKSQILRRSETPFLRLVGPVIDQPNDKNRNALKHWVASNIFPPLQNLASTATGFEEVLWEMFEKGLTTASLERDAVESVCPGAWRKFKLTSVWKARYEEISSDWSERLIELANLCQVHIDSAEAENHLSTLQFLAIADHLIKQYKRSSNVFFLDFFSSCRIGGTPEPDALPGDIGRGLFHRSFRRWMSKTISERRKRCMDTKILVNTVFQGFKRGLLPVSNATIGKQLSGHKKSLTYFQEGEAEAFSDRYGSIFDRVIPEILKGFDFSGGVREGAIPRTATVESTYAQHGELGRAFRFAASKHRSAWLRDTREPVLLQSQQPFLGYSNFSASPEVKAVYDLDLPTDEELLTLSEVQDEFLAHWEEGEAICFDENYDAVLDYCVESIPRDAHDIYEAFWGAVKGTTWWSFSGYSRRTLVMRGARARPAMILEPLKVRIITKPGCFDYVRLRSLQKRMHAHLRQEPAFQLIGGDDPDLVVARLVGEAGWQPGEFWNSGDYSAATDKLRGFVSGMILEKLSEVVDWQTMEDARSTMLGCTIEWDMVPLPSDNNVFETIGKKMGRLSSKFAKAYTEMWRDEWGLTEGKQTNGQLMGNVLSFPILCMANYLTYHISKELCDRRRYTFNELKRQVLINGDDILFKTDRRLFGIWRKVSSHFGFEMSAGKNLVSDDVIQINSQLYQTRTSAVGDFGLNYQGHRIDRIEKIGYVNFGLITNRRKNDCTKDYINKPVLLERMDQQENFDAKLGRLCNIGAIAEMVHETLCWPSEALQGRVERLTQQHRNAFLKAMGLNALSGHFVGSTEVKIWDGFMRSLVPGPGQSSAGAIEMISGLRQVNPTMSAYRHFDSVITLEDVAARILQIKWIPGGLYHWYERYRNTVLASGTGEVGEWSKVAKPAYIAGI